MTNNNIQKKKHIRRQTTSNIDTNLCPFTSFLESFFTSVATASDSPLRRSCGCQLLRKRGATGTGARRCELAALMLPWYKLKWLWNSLKLTWNDHAWACHHHHHLLHLYCRNNRHRKTAKIQDGQKTIEQRKQQKTVQRCRKSKDKRHSLRAQSQQRSTNHVESLT